LRRRAGVLLGKETQVGSVAMRFLMLGSIVLIGVGCNNSSTDPTPTPPGSPGTPGDPGTTVATKLTCVEPVRGSFNCDLMLAQTGGFDITVKSVECGATGNTLKITKPTAATLTDDGCRLAAGTVWHYAGPYTAGTGISFEIASARLTFPPLLRAKGSYPEWEIDFEDGGDHDLNDIILDVKAVPAS
jgi:hypothetical protein